MSKKSYLSNIHEVEKGDESRVLPFIGKCETPPQDLPDLISRLDNEDVIGDLRVACWRKFVKTKNLVWNDILIALNKRKLQKGNKWALIDLFQSYLHANKYEKIEEKRFMNVEQALKYTRLLIEASAGNDTLSVFCHLPVGMWPNYLVNDAESQEIRFFIRQIRVWRHNGILKDDQELLSLSLPDLDDMQLSRISDETLYAKIVINTSYYPKHLSNYWVRKECWRLVNAGDQFKAFGLAAYYFKKKDYTIAFALLDAINDEKLESAKSEYLGLMYFYGHGVKKDFHKARHFLELYLYDTFGVNRFEQVYALGEIYESTKSVKSAIELYQTVLDKPDPQCPFYNKIVDRFLSLQFFCTLGDCIRMTVKISSARKRCRFSVKIPAFCSAMVNWHDPSERNRIHGAGIKAFDRMFVFEHEYARPGIYEINLSATPSRTIEALDFSRYKNQLVDIEFERCKGVKQITLVGQSLTRLKLPDTPYLTGLICRNNSIQYLDVHNAPGLNYLDCSYNPLKRVFGLSKTAIKYICTRATTIDKEEISPVLQLNEGHFCNPFHASQIVKHDMRLEHYFRVTQWQDIRKFLKKNLSEYYWHGYSKCEKVYYILKKMSQINNTTPYTKGYLSVFDEYVSDDNIIHAEDFFLTEKPWSVSLATKVRAERNRQPWMQYEPYRPEYFVSCCLVNMIENQKEMQNRHRF